MKKTMLILGMALVFFACQNAAETPATADSTATSADAAPAVALPYQAEYSSAFTQDVSDADLKTVMDSYKHWEDGNMQALGAAMADSVELENQQGEKKLYPNADLMSMWTKARDSMSSVKIVMVAWHKMKSDKGHDFVLTWYREYDTYKTGVSDSAEIHDINGLRNGKIELYSQYRRPLK
jgi:hypothetical protein